MSIGNFKPLVLVGIPTAADSLSALSLATLGFAHPKIGKANNASGTDLIVTQA
jgi:hypothetical protein